jgi:hypothetical protein
MQLLLIKYANPNSYALFICGSFKSSNFVYLWQLQIIKLKDSLQLNGNILHETDEVSYYSLVHVR